MNKFKVALYKQNLPGFDKIMTLKFEKDIKEEETEKLISKAEPELKSCFQ